MRQNATKTAGFAWSSKSELAADLVAKDDLTDQQIADRIGIHRATLDRWKAHPEFAAKVQSIIADYRKAVLSQGIAVIENRVAALNDRWRRAHRVIESRARRYRSHRANQIDAGIDTKLVPEEAETGLVILIETPTKQGVKREWAADTALLAEIRNHEQQAAKELGQWKDRAEVEVRDTSALEALKRRLLPQAGSGGDREPAGESAGK